jgi:hypothetical protein
LAKNARKAPRLEVPILPPKLYSAEKFEWTDVGARRLMVKIRGLTVMAIGAICIGVGTGNLPQQVSFVFGGLSLLLLGFTWLMA